jgi:hypothetical protein
MAKRCDARRQAVGLEPITEYLDGARRTLL